MPTGRACRLTAEWGHMSDWAPGGITGCHLRASGRKQRKCMRKCYTQARKSCKFNPTKTTKYLQLKTHRYTHMTQISQFQAPWGRRYQSWPGGGGAGSRRLGGTAGSTGRWSFQSLDDAEDGTAGGTGRWSSPFDLRHLLDERGPRARFDQRRLARRKPAGRRHLLAFGRLRGLAILGRCRGGAHARCSGLSTDNSRWRPSSRHYWLLRCRCRSRLREDLLHPQAPPPESTQHSTGCYPATWRARRNAQNKSEQAQVLRANVLFKLPNSTCAPSN